MRARSSGSVSWRAAGTVSKRQRVDPPCRSSATWPGHTRGGSCTTGDEVEDGDEEEGEDEDVDFVASRTAARLWPPRRACTQPPLLADWKLNMIYFCRGYSPPLID